MTDADKILANGRSIVQEMRESGADFDYTDKSIWFIQGALSSMYERGEQAPEQRAVEKFAYAIYLADLLATTCHEVTVFVDFNNGTINDVIAKQKECSELTLAWVLQCAADPDADNIVFKYAGALRDFGEQQRAHNLYQQLREN